MDDPLMIVNSAIDQHKKMIKQMKGVPGGFYEVECQMTVCKCYYRAMDIKWLVTYSFIVYVFCYWQYSILDPSSSSISIKLEQSFRSSFEECLEQR